MKKLFALLLALAMMLSVSMVSAETLECDVVVVGGGGAGMSAALSAAENGAKVILIEKQGYLGGATMMSGGIVPAVGTKQQKEAGIEDNLEWFVRDIERPSNYAVREDLVCRKWQDCCRMAGRHGREVDRDELPVLWSEQLPHALG